MNAIRMGLTIAVVWCVLPAQAAPVPVGPPPAQGPITDALRLRTLLPTTAPLRVVPAVIAANGTIELERRTVHHVMEAVTQMTQTPKGPVTYTTYVSKPVTVVSKLQVPVKSCKFFVVTKDGKLETLDAEKAAEMLKKATPVLSGESTEIDPRTLELIRPGTLCVINLPPAPTNPPPILPEIGPRN